MTTHPARYVRVALSSLGIRCDELSIEDYNPEVFGNFDAVARTDVGILRILYDREFWIEAKQPLPPHLSEQAIASAMDHAMRNKLNSS
ncbi:hypothetical protein [Blastomonas fulva]|uniref:hypothetical protein n=1 Tax=Blastomonas fulva TaxID=1550728 RepID=UPI004034361C